MPRNHRTNPFGIPEDDEYFDEKLAYEAANDVGEVNMSKALEWLENWNRQESEKELKEKELKEQKK